MKNILIFLLLLSGCDNFVSQKALSSDCLNNAEISQLMECAENGNLESQYELGMAYLDGQNTAQNTQKAFDWISQSAQSGYMPAQNMMSWFYRTGTVVNRNDKEAFNWAVRAAESGSLNSLNNVGFYYQQGIGVEQNQKKGLEYYLKAAKQGNISAQKNLGLAYLNGWGTESNPQEALFWFLKLSEQNDPEAMVNAAAIYKVLGNHQEELMLMKRAANLNYILAQTNLGYMYATGEGAPLDKAQALFWLNKSMNEGDKNAYYLMGKFHAESSGAFPLNEAEAFQYYLKSAELGSRDGQNAIANWLMNGRYVKKNEVKALKWYEQAANNGLIEAIQTLIKIYGQGTEKIPKDNVKKQYWENKLELREEL
ncbi:tetratricopeptide repeat protein [Neisseria zalophi]|uniref:Sel1 repeat family protein n=1 Tax=Neisseria zalophi TaxID=640030 RepID=A0A5J6PYH0_9NEIS|nr:SEL1-like repeat protein [Neisseria zalophi]QEY26183.1 hypothetical protein D0T92_06355 [Neisseria zalophi]